LLALRVALVSCFADVHLREVGVVLDQLGLETSSSQQFALQKLFRSILQGLSAIKAMATGPSRSRR
jgi:hypothetical protein